jgi:hypothetical protein
MRSGHAPRSTNKSDLLPARDSVSFRHQRATQMEVSGYHSIAVNDLNDIGGKEKPVDKGNDSTVGSNYW